MKKKEIIKVLENVIDMVNNEDAEGIAITGVVRFKNDSHELRLINGYVDLEDLFSAVEDLKKSLLSKVKTDNTVN